LSTFAVTIEKLGKIDPHPNADRLEIGHLEGMGFQFIIGKDQFKEGDLVVYFPVDSLLPLNIIETLGLVGKLSGRDKNRIRTIKLRGAISQGIVADPAAFGLINVVAGQNFTDELGVIKYELPEYIPGAGKPRPEWLKALPEHVAVYDLESAERYLFVLESIATQPVVITEKVEGSHFAISITNTNEVIISQRKFRIEAPQGEHAWLTTATKMNLPVKMLAIKQHFQHLNPTIVTLRGEIIGPGIQGNYYNLEEHTIKFFEVEVDGVSQPPYALLEMEKYFQIPLVPFLFYGLVHEFTNGKTIGEASNGESYLRVGALREGIVIRPLQERSHPLLGRLILKQRSPEYLAGSEL
jgi:RNA ligase (TIGR02306 family)